MRRSPRPQQNRSTATVMSRLQSQLAFAAPLLEDQRLNTITRTRCPLHKVCIAGIEDGVGWFSQSGIMGGVEAPRSSALVAITFVTALLP